MSKRALFLASFLAAVAACGGTSTPASTGPGSGGAGDTGGGAATDGSTGGPVAGGTPEKVKVVNEPGQYVALDEVLVPGIVTVVDFYADWCGACDLMEEKLLEATADEPRIVLRKIDVVDSDSEVSRHYSVGALPHMRIYGPDGNLAHTLVGNEALKAAALSRALLPQE